jgi:hypothetical protein
MIPGMYHRTSPIVVVMNAVRATVQLLVVGALTIGAFAVLNAYGYQFDPVLAFVNDQLVRIVTS